MSTNLREKQQSEGLERMVEIQNKFGLNPNLIKYLDEGKVYYSYITGNGIIGSIDTIDYDEKYVQIIKDFEKKRKAYVYHAIESKGYMGEKEYEFLSLLYVSKNEEDWPIERIEDNYIQAYVVNLRNNKLSEIGDIFLDAFKGIMNDYSVLVRIG